MINHEQFRKYIIYPTLFPLSVNGVSLYSRNAEELLIATMAHGSKGGTFLKQQEGPALGVYKMEPNTYDELYSQCIKKDSSLQVFGVPPFKEAAVWKSNAVTMIWDLAWATVMARLFYLRIEEELPYYDDLEEIWNYYKKYWNTMEGKATREEFIKDYYEYTKE